MKSEEIKIHKIVADEGYIFVSKERKEEFGLSIPEFYGKQVFLATEASTEDFEEMLESEALALQAKYHELAEEQFFKDEGEHNDY